MCNGSSPLWVKRSMTSCWVSPNSFVQSGLWNVHNTVDRGVVVRVAVDCMPSPCFADAFEWHCWLLLILSDTGANFAMPGREVRWQVFSRIRVNTATFSRGLQCVFAFLASFRRAPRKGVVLGGARVIQITCLARLTCDLISIACMLSILDFLKYFCTYLEWSPASWYEGFFSASIGGIYWDQ